MAVAVYGLQGGFPANVHLIKLPPSKFSFSEQFVRPTDTSASWLSSFSRSGCGCTVFNMNP